ncbi:hypothetical protein BC830DRAFT_326909 [Chytriomyces sp. MP71]|nr:hypothetical protein BC830DRAFT_326909 [Chytriomyces sp. MP71]
MEYIDSLISSLHSVPAVLPSTRDFLDADPDGIHKWLSLVNKSLPEVMIGFLTQSHFSEIEKVPTSSLLADPTLDGDLFPQPIDVDLKVVGAKAIVSMDDGSARDVLCRVEVVQGVPDTLDGTPAHRVFTTEVCARTNTPAWYHDVHVSCARRSERFVVSVWDARSEDFLGQVALDVASLHADVVAGDARGTVGGWYPLEPMSGNSWNKYVGGFIFLEIRFGMQEEDEDPEAHLINFVPYATLMGAMTVCGLDPTCLYKTLMLACINIAIASSADEIQDQLVHTDMRFLSPGSRVMLELWREPLGISKHMKDILYLDLVFAERKKRHVGEVPVWALLNAYESIHRSLKAGAMEASLSNGSLSSASAGRFSLKESYEPFTDMENLILNDVLGDIYKYYKAQLADYVSTFKERLPDLETTLLLLRMVSKNIVFRDFRPDVPASFRAELKGVLAEAAQSQFLLLFQAAKDENDRSTIVQTLISFCDLLLDDLRDQHKIFRTSFELELDIVKLVVESYVGRLNSIIENQFVTSVHHHPGLFDAMEVLSLFNGLKRFILYACKLSPSIKKTIHFKMFDLAKWFSFFVPEWLQYLKDLKVSSFESLPRETEDANDFSPGSCSAILQCFDSAYETLSTFIDFDWGLGGVDLTVFVEEFGEIVHHMTAEWCNGIVEGNSVTPTDKMQHTLLNQTTNPVCVQMCEIEAVNAKLWSIHHLIDASTTQIDNKVESTSSWFVKSQESIEKAQKILLQILATEIGNCTQVVISEAVVKQEAAILPAPMPRKKLFVKQETIIQYSNVTVEGVSVNAPMESFNVEALLTDLIQHTQRVMEALPSGATVQELIKCTWDKVINSMTDLMVPPLFGEFEVLRRPLNVRQLSMCSQVMQAFYDVFYAFSMAATGNNADTLFRGGMGTATIRAGMPNSYATLGGDNYEMSFEFLDSHQFANVAALVTNYFEPAAKVRVACDSINTRKNLPLLRLMRLRIDRPDTRYPVSSEIRNWFERVLVQS